ncbi:MAG TPA: hypothetical protein VFG43_00310, partial [Geminicoccaceae bacterium]|nr:hypothetical protein [Geminicoccaceae bacterium]
MAEDELPGAGELGGEAAAPGELGDLAVHGQKLGVAALGEPRLRRRRPEVEQQQDQLVGRRRGRGRRVRRCGFGGRARVHRRIFGRGGEFVRAVFVRGRGLGFIVRFQEQILPPRGALGEEAAAGAVEAALLAVDPRLHPVEPGLELGVGEERREGGVAGSERGEPVGEQALEAGELELAERDRLDQGGLGRVLRREIVPALPAHPVQVLLPLPGQEREAPGALAVAEP